MTIRTRFAPSPTGYMHIGNLRTAIYEYLIAKRHHGQFILRIEDTDQERLVEGATNVIFETLKTVNIDFDEGPGKGGEYGPYVQSERRQIYREYADKLVELGGAYYCFCGKERLEQLRSECESAGKTYRYDGCCKNVDNDLAFTRVKNGENHVVRQVIPTGGHTTFTDVVYGTITVENSELEEGVLLKADGLPTYNFANVVDDHLMKITHVIRGSEYLSSTPKYNVLYSAFGWELPIYIHLPPIMKTKDKKLSKREGDASFEDFINRGFLKEAIVNYIVLLGWNPGTEQEFFTIDELKQCFEVQGLSKSPAIFDVQKLRWMNSEYIKRLSVEEYLQYAKPYFIQAGLVDIDLHKLSVLLKNRTEIFSEIPEKISFIKNLPQYDIALFTHKKMKTDSGISLAVLKRVLPVLQDIQQWSVDDINNSLMNIVAESGLKNSQVLWPVRTALTGMESSPGGAAELADILGQSESIRRLELAIQKLV
ncbi:MAG: glutamate--tRNA ligase [Bacillota bacterium]